MINSNKTYFAAVFCISFKRFRSCDTCVGCPVFALRQQHSRQIYSAKTDRKQPT